MLQSFDPASRELIWEGPVARPADCDRAIAAARAALPGWRASPVEDRIAVVRRYAAILSERRADLAQLIARETGKLLWESDAEVGSMIAKVEISIQAHAERTGERAADMPFGRAVLRHRGHGVMAVLGPYNFPGHLPNGHIVPALIAGNAVVFKPSEITPATGAAMADAWAAAGLPDGLLTLVQGGRATGEALVAGDIDGLLFTGSAGAGAALRRALVDRPHVIMALELGGNNPLIAWDSPDAAASIIVNSAFITTGQRCSCARRLIVPEGATGDAIVEATAALAALLPIAAWNEAGEAFMGPLVSDQAAASAHRAVSDLIARGARVIRPFEALADRSAAFVTPAMLDLTGIDAPDAEIFAPVLSVVRVADFDAAIAAANATSFGLSAGLVSQDEALWRRVVEESRAGVVNRNRPTTGAAGNMPFGGLGASGNHRPSAYYAADYCAYPIASFEADGVAAVPVNGLNSAAA
ncbi:succinylglutamate-semialdehyde dehydrogenase [Pseudooceanicola nanhaiensis]|uniref:succinylglutamate-semialdehyde dehydrogenase n=1 Tax=Pseudooceanicola nanhaiensis TaxID=375761 RepID=UPI000C6277E6|nr:succinylglutamate-semialdehyde dehydrogenase [Sphingobium sp.]MCC4251930.1 succinylglutamate-semialdehyde dehydrogenase [Sphingobium naphthae]MEC8035664.1 succinylglutamate-semialdehyde dehydrogenase [Pseudomonadota bacterium]